MFIDGQGEERPSQRGMTVLNEKSEQRLSTARSLMWLDQVDLRPGLAAFSSSNLVEGGYWLCVGHGSIGFRSAGRRKRQG
jgi:hypothetical protein